MFCRTFVAYTVITTLLVSQISWGGSLPPSKNSVSISEVQTVINYPEKFAAAYEQKQFDKDFEAIVKAYPSNQRRQYQLLLLREQINANLEASFKYESVAGTHDLSFYKTMLQDSPIYRGLYKKVNDYERNLKKQPLSILTLVLSVLLTSLAYEEVYNQRGAVVSEKKKWDRWVKVGHLDNKEGVAAKITQLENSINDYNEKLDKIMSASYLVMGLLHPEEKTLDHGVVSRYYLNIVDQYRALIKGGHSGEGLIQKFYEQNLNLFQQNAKLMNQKIKNSLPYFWIRGTGAESHFRIFMKHHSVRSHVMTHVPHEALDSFMELDKKILIEEGFLDDKLEWKFHDFILDVNSTAEVVKKWSTKFLAFAVNKGFGAGYGLSKTFYDYSMQRELEQGSRLGAYLGLNSYTMARQIELADGVQKVVVAGLVSTALMWMTFYGSPAPPKIIPGSLSIRSGGPLLATVSSASHIAKAFGGGEYIPPTILERLFGTTFGVTLALAPWGRDKPLRAMMYDSNFRFNMTASLLVTALLGYHWKVISSQPLLKAAGLVSVVQNMNKMIQNVHAGKSTTMTDILTSTSLVVFFTMLSRIWSVIPLTDMVERGLQHMITQNPMAMSVVQQMTTNSMSIAKSWMTTTMGHEINESLQYEEMLQDDLVKNLRIMDKTVSLKEISKEFPPDQNLDNLLKGF